MGKGHYTNKQVIQDDAHILACSSYCMVLYVFSVVHFHYLTWNVFEPSIIKGMSL
jgi:hypothetical protein